MLATKRQGIKPEFHGNNEFSGILDLSHYIDLNTVDVEKLLEWLKYQIKTFQILERVNVNRENSASTSLDTPNQRSC